MVKAMKAASPSLVQKKKTLSTLCPTKAKDIKKDGVTKKIRVGILVGKDFDPVKKGTQWPTFPKELMLTDSDWGKYSIDAATAIKLQQLHPDLLEVDIIPGKQVSEKRLKQNHVNINFWYDVGVSMLSGDKKHIAEVMKCHKNPECRLDPSWDYYDWVLCKPRYMKQCIKAGIPMIPTVMYENGFDPKQCMKDVQKKGWDKFFVKVGHFTFFGCGAINGKTEDFLGHKAKELEKYAKENQNSKVFLLQPYMLKPNGEVFDEVRNFFIDGQWRYSVFTHGTEGGNAGYYMEPDGPRKEACKAMAERAYQQVLKAATWQGKRQTPLLNRIDIGIIPKVKGNPWAEVNGVRVKGGDTLHKTDNQYFLNEVELIMTTWLDRYSPISVSDAMAHASVKHTMELLQTLLEKKKVPDEAHVRKAVKVLNARLGPFKHIKV